MTLGTEFHLVAAGHRHPDTVLRSEDLERVLPNLNEGWADTYLGMGARRVALNHERMADYGVGALQDALGRAGWQSDELDLIVCGATFLEELAPPRSSVIAESVNPSMLAFDVNAACSSFVYALAIARSLMITDTRLRRAAVSVVERPTASADYGNSRSSVFFGDSAGTALLQRGGTGFAIAGLAMINDAIGSEEVRIPLGGHFQHDNRAAFRHVVDMGEMVTKKVLEEAAIGISDVRAFVGHQANQAVLKALGERLGISWDLQWHNFEWAGNQGAAGVLTAFSNGWNDSSFSLNSGDHIVLATVGSGYSAGALALRWDG